MRRNILRSVDCIIFSCFLESVHVLEAWFIVGGDHHVEMAKSVLQEVRFRGQLLFVFEEQRPGCPDSILGLNCLLVAENLLFVQDILCFLPWTMSQL